MCGRVAARVETEGDKQEHTHTPDVWRQREGDTQTTHTHTPMEGESGGARAAVAGLSLNITPALFTPHGLGE